MSDNVFGGDWTEDKLNRLYKYLLAYRQIFTANKKASFLSTTYVDAFAGTGDRQDSKDESEEYKIIKDGSARLALSLPSPFNHYLFIEKKIEYAKQLESLKQEFNHPSITILQGDANIRLQDWCHRTNWSKNRAVVFLDPFGMQVDWLTIQAIAQTQSIDLWLWFPLGQAVNRLLTKDVLPQPSHEARLTRMFGSDDWKDKFYRLRQQPTLYDYLVEEEDQSREKIATFTSINDYFIERLRSIFAAVAPNPRPFFNSMNNPLYMLYFASGNPRGSKTAVQIAQHILSK